MKTPRLLIYLNAGLRNCFLERSDLSSPPALILGRWAGCLHCAAFFGCSDAGGGVAVA